MLKHNITNCLFRIKFNEKQVELILTSNSFGFLDLVYIYCVTNNHFVVRRITLICCLLDEKVLVPIYVLTV